MEINKIIISKKWDSPQITLKVDDVEISIEMLYKEFISSLVSDIGNPSFLVTKKALESKISSAFINVIKEMKNQTRNI